MKIYFSLLWSIIILLSVSIITSDCATIHFGMFKTWLISYHSNDYVIIIRHLMINLALLFFIIYAIVFKVQFQKQFLWLITSLIITMMVMTNFALKTNIRLQTLDSNHLIEQSGNIYKGVSFFLNKPKYDCEN